MNTTYRDNAWRPTNITNQGLYSLVLLESEEQTLTQAIENGPPSQNYNVPGGGSLISDPTGGAGGYQEFGFNSAIYGGDITQPEAFRDTSAAIDTGFGTIGISNGVYGSQIYIPPTNTQANRESSDGQSTGGYLVTGQNGLIEKGKLGYEYFLFNAESLGMQTYVKKLDNEAYTSQNSTDYYNNTFGYTLNTDDIITVSFTPKLEDDVNDSPQIEFAADVLTTSTVTTDEIGDLDFSPTRLNKQFPPTTEGTRTLTSAQIGVASLNTTISKNSIPNKAETKTFISMDYAPHRSVQVLAGNISNSFSYQAEELEYRIRGLGNMSGNYKFSHGGNASPANTPTYVHHGTLDTPNPFKTIKVGPLGTSITDSNLDASPGNVNTPHGSPTGSPSRINYFSSPAQYVKSIVPTFGSPNSGIRTSVMYTGNKTSVIGNYSNYPVNLTTLISGSGNAGASVLNNVSAERNTNIVLTPNSQTVVSDPLSRFSIEGYKTNSPTHPLNASDVSNDHLLLNLIKQGRNFGMASSYTGRALNFFVHAVEESRIDFYDNCPSHGSNGTPVTGMQRISLKAGENGRFISTKLDASPGGKSICFIKSTANIVVGSASFNSPDSPNRSLQSPKGAIQLIPLGGESHVFHQTSNNLFVIDENLVEHHPNTSPGVVKVIKCHGLTRTNPNAKDLFINSPDSLVFVNNSPNANSLLSSPNSDVTVNSPALVLVLDQEEGTTQVANSPSSTTLGTRRLDMADTYVWPFELKDFTIVTPTANSITLNYQLKNRTNSPVSGEYTYQTFTFNSPIATPNSPAVSTFFNQSPALIGISTAPAIDVAGSPSRVTPKLWKFKGRRPFMLVVNGFSEKTQTGLNTNTFNANFTSQGAVALTTLPTHPARITAADGTISTQTITINQSLLSHYNKIHDSNYYQEYSYEISAPLRIEEWAEKFQRLVHPAGLKYFGNYSPN